ncbi:hypothetical protein G647_08683 [Cladophialophora carrionii CBS 160.54]|uniref:Uncharacterized protein n=1 Tax=Cladophialophora carrionii CBS 160.54 TaxID=1279043 RepID=V9CYE1_9EURO|nr:uncharacterized protein G647_08683 [Cladophialophora carrionii CBS 160.54]ETI19670.1 hypothetical protein G647_08683 [Cladophialophora carrionii CBS 160.54]
MSATFSQGSNLDQRQWCVASTVKTQIYLPDRTFSQQASRPASRRGYTKALLISAHQKVWPQHWASSTMTARV